ncbi:hypothetical protein B1A_00419 [mine drainage metagenome]|uniref:Anti-sigma K factor RskA C-terminal domain-containing protein n=1 Tax=mine drainage metagenome TaxID=410659 RepID=T1C5Y9_9ZZZZ
MAADPHAAAAEAQWRQRLLPLAEEIGPETPPPQVWARIRAALEFDAPARAADARGGWWENIRLWHWLTFGSGALLAAACAALVVLATHRPPTPPIPYMAATIMQTDGQVGWTATMDVGKARMIVVPAAPQPVRAGRTPELWLIPQGARPIAVGLISTRAHDAQRSARAWLPASGRPPGSPYPSSRGAAHPPGNPPGRSSPPAPSAPHRPRRCASWAPRSAPPEAPPADPNDRAGAACIQTGARTV